MLAGRAASDAAVDDPYDVAELLRELINVRAEEQAATLAARSAAHTALDNLHAVARLLQVLDEAGRTEQVAVLADRAAVSGPIEDLWAVIELLHTLRDIGANEQASVLLNRNPAGHAALDNPDTLGFWLEKLRDADMKEQVAVLAARAAAHATLNFPDIPDVSGDPDDPDAPPDSPPSVWTLLHALQNVGAHEHTEVLMNRLPGAGLFELFCEDESRKERFRFGRQADGTPAGHWAWDDLA